MIKIILSKDMLQKDSILPSTDNASAAIIEVDDEESFCEGCSSDIFVETPDITQDFIWHPKKKF